MIPFKEIKLWRKSNPKNNILTMGAGIQVESAVRIDMKALGSLVGSDGKHLVSNELLEKTEADLLNAVWNAVYGDVLRDVMELRGAYLSTTLSAPHDDKFISLINKLRHIETQRTQTEINGNNQDDKRPI